MHSCTAAANETRPLGVISSNAGHATADRPRSVLGPFKGCASVLSRFPATLDSRL